MTEAANPPATLGRGLHSNGMPHSWDQTRKPTRGSSNEPKSKKLKGSRRNLKTSLSDFNVSSSGDDVRRRDRRPPLQLEDIPEVVPAGYQFADAPAGAQHAPSAETLPRYDNKFLPSSALHRGDPSHGGSILLQPEYRPISTEQLLSLVKSIYTGLIQVESTCKDVVRAQSTLSERGLHGGNDQGPSREMIMGHTVDTWKEIVELHRQLLIEYHNFLFVTQHPSAPPSLRRLAVKYSIPSRMWKHGIYYLLELLRSRLPETLEFFDYFSYYAYETVGVLFEATPTFESSWMEMLGDLSRYRMAVEVAAGGSATWCEVGRSWYRRAINKRPGSGRLHHHLGILSTNNLERLYHLARALTSTEQFLDARENLTAFLDELCQKQDDCHEFAAVHSTLIKANSPGAFNHNLESYVSQLDNYISRVRSNWKVIGTYSAIINIVAMFEYGSKDSTLARTIRETNSKMLREADDSELLNKPKNKTDLGTTLIPFSDASRLAFSTMKVALQRTAKDPYVYDHVHTMLIFLTQIAGSPFFPELSRHAPWDDLVVFLNDLKDNFFHEESTSSLPDVHYQSPSTGTQPKRRSLPEEVRACGQIWCQDFFPADWFDDVDVDEIQDEMFNSSAYRVARMGRILGLGANLASLVRQIHFDNDSYKFSVVPESLESLQLLAQTSNGPHRTENPCMYRIPETIGLPIVIETSNGLATVMSYPDTGSDVNIVSLELAQLLMLSVQEDIKDKKQFVLANGQITTALGTAVIKYGFSSEYPTREPTMLSQFYIFRTSASSMIIGRPFLEETRTMTDFRSRLVRTSSPAQRSFYIQAVGTQRKRLLCIIQNQKVLAVADSGAELNLMSLSYLRRRGFHLDPGNIPIIFADGSEGRTLGTVNVKLSFRLGEEVTHWAIETQHRLVQLRMSNNGWTEFHILESLVADVVLGADFLEAQRIFEECQHSFVELPDEPRLLPSVHGVMHLNDKERSIARGMRRLKRLVGKRGRNQSADEETDLEMEIEEEDQRENARREGEELRIAAISGEEERRKAKEEEERKRRVYDERKRVKSAAYS